MPQGPLDMRLPRSCATVACCWNETGWRGSGRFDIESNLKKKPKEEKRYT